MNFWLIATALIFIGLAVFVMGRGEARQKQRQAVARLDAALTQTIDPMKLEKDPLKKKFIPQWITDSLISAGLPVDQAMGLKILAIVGLPPLFMLMLKGFANGVGMFILCLMLFTGFILYKQRKRRAQMLAQLPTFLDALVRVSSVGYSITVSFNTAVETAEEPLKDALGVAVQMQFAGLELDEAMHRLARIYRLTEFKLIASVVSLALTYGGKSDILLGRLGQYLRDREAYQKEMMAMSAEARMSAIFMSSLNPLLVGFILAFRPDYLGSMWADPTGKLVLLFGLAIQTVGVMLIYHMVKGIK
ncbi:MAG: type II secretion system F family protein [Limnobacter sp.]|nr:type II secretion system F family protein [Limnobacter sp.]